MYIKLNEQNQTIEYPPINKDNVCNYNIATDLLEADGYVDIEQNLIGLFNQGKGKIENNNISDISQTPEYIAEQVQERQAKFESNFFLIPDFGWYRKHPKGYSSAIESLNTVFNAVTVLQNLPANYITFYTAPDFTDEQECTEDWLIENSFKNEAMTAQQFALFYQKAVTVWNTTEH